MIIEMLFAFIMIGICIYLATHYLPKFLLNFRKRLNPMMIDLSLVKEKGVSHLGLFGASRAFDQIDLDLSEMKQPHLQVKLKPTFKKVYVEYLCFDKNGNFLSVLLYLVALHDSTMILLPQHTTHVIPVVAMIDDLVYDWNTYLLPKWKFLSFALLESIVIGYIIHYLIQFIYSFYRTFSSTCPLCQFGNENLLQFLTWIIGSLSFIVIFIFGQPRFNQYLYGGFVDGSNR